MRAPPFEYHAPRTLAEALRFLDELDEARPLAGGQESPSSRNPGGFKGMGESGAIGAPAAVVNAVADPLRPLGVRIRQTDLRPAVLAALIDRADEERRGEEGQRNG